ncbi:MAG: hypothetical protein R3E31_02685 [Chloroflexota bacterium]
MPEIPLSEFDIDPKRLYTVIEQNFNDSELRQLCFDLKINYEDDLEAGNTAAKKRSLVSFMGRQRRLVALVQTVCQHRPHIDPQRLQKQPDKDRCPYQGLRYFDVTDAPRFFGREALTAKLVTHLRNHNFLAVVGASGSGKSSVVRAGLVPVLQGSIPLLDNNMLPEGSNRWLYHILTPTEHPLEALADELTDALGSFSAYTELVEKLATNPRSLHLAVRRVIRRANAPQLTASSGSVEELFTQCREEGERLAFIENLLTAVSETNSPTYLVITVRADFYRHCGAYAPLRDLLEQQQAYIGPMDVTELRQAIMIPARQSGLIWRKGCQSEMLNDIGAAEQRTPEPGAFHLTFRFFASVSYAQMKGRGPMIYPQPIQHSCHSPS